MSHVLANTVMNSFKIWYKVSARGAGEKELRNDTYSQNGTMIQTKVTARPPQKSYIL